MLGYTVIQQAELSLSSLLQTTATDRPELVLIFLAYSEIALQKKDYSSAMSYATAAALQGSRVYSKSGASAKILETQSQIPKKLGTRSLDFLTKQR